MDSSYTPRKISENLACKRNPNQPWCEFKHMESVSKANQNWQRKGLEKQGAAGTRMIYCYREKGSLESWILLLIHHIIWPLHPLGQFRHY